MYIHKCLHNQGLRQDQIWHSWYFWVGSVLSQSPGISLSSMQSVLNYAGCQWSQETSMTAKDQKAMGCYSHALFTLSITAFSGRKWQWHRSHKASSVSLADVSIELILHGVACLWYNKELLQCSRGPGIWFRIKYKCVCLLGGPCNVSVVLNLLPCFWVPNFCIWCKRCDCHLAIWMGFWKEVCLFF